MRWHGVEQLSQPFRYEVTLARDAARGPADLRGIVDGAATLAIVHQGGVRPVHGVVGAAEELDRTRALYVSELVPHLVRAPPRDVSIVPQTRPQGRDRHPSPREHRRRGRRPHRAASADALGGRRPHVVSDADGRLSVVARRRRERAAPRPRVPLDRDPIQRVGLRSALAAARGGGPDVSLRTHARGLDDGAERSARRRARVRRGDARRAARARGGRGGRAARARARVPRALRPPAARGARRRSRPHGAAAPARGPHRWRRRAVDRRARAVRVAGRTGLLRPLRAHRDGAPRGAARAREWRRRRARARAGDARRGPRRRRSSR